MNRLKEEWPQNILKEAGIEEATDKNIKILEKTLAFANDRQKQMVEMYYIEGMSWVTTSLEVVPQDERYRIDTIIDWKYRVRDAY